MNDYNILKWFKSLKENDVVVDTIKGLPGADRVMNVVTQCEEDFVRFSVRDPHSYLPTIWILAMTEEKASEILDEDVSIGGYCTLFDYFRRYDILEVNGEPIQND